MTTTGKVVLAIATAALMLQFAPVPPAKAGQSMVDRWRLYSALENINRQLQQVEYQAIRNRRRLSKDHAAILAALNALQTDNAKQQPSTAPTRPGAGSTPDARQGN